MTQPTDPGRFTAVVTWTDPAAVDNVDPNPTISCTPVSGSEFVVGITEVVCEASDSNENRDECAFNVNVTGLYVLAIVFKDKKGFKENSRHQTSPVSCAPRICPDRSRH